MAKNTPVMALSIIVGIVLLIVAFVYFTKTADQLPLFFPGHDVALTTKHIKHGIGALLLGIGSFVLAWFQSGPTTGQIER
jgi:hypothetical protein